MCQSTKWNIKRMMIFTKHSLFSDTKPFQRLSQMSLIRFCSTMVLWRKPQSPAESRRFQQEQLRAVQAPSRAATSGSPKRPCQSGSAPPSLLNYFFLSSLCKGAVRAEQMPQASSRRPLRAIAPKAIRTKRPSAQATTINRLPPHHHFSILLVCIFHAENGHGVRKPGGTYIKQA